MADDTQDSAGAIILQRPNGSHQCDEMAWVLVQDGNQTIHKPVEFEMFYCIPEVAFVFGYVIPAIAFVALVTNSMASVVLLRAEMRTPTNLILLAIGAANTLTACSPLPVYAYFYTLGNYVRPIPAGWCTPYRVFLDYLPTTFHTVAIWLTTSLALQRYVYVCQPDYVQRLCSSTTSVITTIVITLVSFLAHGSRLFDFRCEDVATIDNGTTFYASSRSFSDWLITDSTLNESYFTVQYWTRCIFINVIPCTLLIVLTGILLRKVRQTASRRRRLVKRRDIQALEDSNRLTVMLVVVVTIFLVVEIPSGIFTILAKLSAVQTRKMHLLTQLIINVCILVSYPINFFVYCAMSRQFRTIFVQVMLPFVRQSSSNSPTVTKTTHATKSSYTKPNVSK